MAREASGTASTGRTWLLVLDALSDRLTPVAREATSFRLPLIAVASSLAVAVSWLAVDRSIRWLQRISRRIRRPRSPRLHGRARIDRLRRPARESDCHRVRRVPVGAAGRMLSTVWTVKGRAPMTGYERESFAFGSDTDGNGCETRDDVLARDLVQRAVLSVNRCVTETGQLHDPYSGGQIDFTRVDSAVDVDHVVALGNAWATGAFRWGRANQGGLRERPVEPACGGHVAQPAEG